MNRTPLLAAVALAIVAASAATAAEPLPQLYRKSNGIAAVLRQGDAAQFEIQSSAGQNSCSLEGTARFIDANRAAFTSADQADQCVVLLNLSGGRLAVTSKGCEGYCGMNAAGTMDGTYSRAAK